MIRPREASSDESSQSAPHPMRMHGHRSQAPKWRAWKPLSWTLVQAGVPWCFCFPTTNPGIADYNPRRVNNIEVASEAARRGAAVLLQYWEHLNREDADLK